MQKITDKKWLRIIDANFNRAKEGLRVCEDICRFIYNQKVLTRKYKDARHCLTDIISQVPVFSIIHARNTSSDVGRVSSPKELERKRMSDIFYANSQRVKESIRVLEEFMKLVDKRLAEKVKRLRYQVYFLERQALTHFK